MRGMRLTRRKALLGALALLALVEVAVAFAVLRGDESEPATARPLHPVAGSFVPDATTLGDCSDGACFEQAFGNVAFNEGPRVAISLFERTVDQGEPSCHRIAHAIGAASLARYQGNVAKTIAEGSSTCFSGYYHGVLERALVGVKTRDSARLGNVARALCDDPQVHVSRWMEYQCFHGLGHGLMITTGYGLPMSLEACERIQTFVDKTSCKGGVFMENISSSYGFRSRWLRDDDPVYPCNVVDADDKVTCYAMVSSRVLRVIGLDWQQAAAICSRVESDYVITCFRSLGRDISGQTRRDPEEIVELCEVAREYEAEEHCISAAAMDMASNFTSGLKGAEVCEAAPAGTRGECYYGVGGVMGRFTRTASESEADCRMLTTTIRHVLRCIEGTKIKGSLTVTLAR